MLDVVLDSAVQGEYTYLWKFNGSVYRILFNSEIDYLVLRVGDRVTALSTAGFTAGTEYTKLRANGMSSQKFDYSLWMTGSTLSPDFADMAMEMAVEEEIYPLGADTEQALYYYDLYFGPVELMEVPFGAYVDEEKEDHT